MGDILYRTEMPTTREPCNLLEYTFENGVVVGFGTVAGEEIGYIIPSERFELSDEDVRVGLDFIRGLTGREVVENGRNGNIRNFLLGEINAEA